MSKKSLPEEFYKVEQTQSSILSHEGSADAILCPENLWAGLPYWEIPSIQPIPAKILKKILICSPGIIAHHLKNTFLLPKEMVNLFLHNNIQSIYLLDHLTGKSVEFYLQDGRRPQFGSTNRNYDSRFVYCSHQEDFQYLPGTTEFIQGKLKLLQENLNDWLILDHHDLDRLKFFISNINTTLHIQADNFRITYGHCYEFEKETKKITLDEKDILRLQSYRLEGIQKLWMSGIMDPLRLLTPVLAKMKSLNNVIFTQSDLKILHILPRNIRNLNILDCTGLDDLRILSSFPLLEELRIRNAHLLKSIDLRDNIHLKEVALYNTAVTPESLLLPAGCQSTISNDNSSSEKLRTEDKLSTSDQDSVRQRHRIDTDTFTSPTTEYKLSTRLFFAEEGQLVQAEPETIVDTLSQTVKDSIIFQDGALYFDGDHPDELDQLPDDVTITRCPEFYEEELQQMSPAEYFVNTVPNPREILAGGWFPLLLKEKSQPRKIAVAGAALKKIVKSPRHQFWIKLAHIDPDQLTVQWIAATAERSLSPRVPFTFPTKLKKRISSFITTELTGIPTKPSQYHQILMTMQLLLKQEIRGKDTFFPAQLQIYLSQFGNQDLKLPSTGIDDLDKMLAMFKQGVGSCRHRSELFVLLCQCLGIAAASVGNPWHVRGKTLTDSYELKGHAAQFTQSSQPLLITVKHPVISYKRLFSPWLEFQPTPATLTELIDKILAVPQLFIPVKDMPEARGIYQALFHRADKSRPFYYVESFPQLQQALGGMAISDDGKPVKTIGRLTEVLAKGGILVINWEHFSENAMLETASLMDQQQKFGKIAATAPVTVFNLITPAKIMACRALSRRAPHLKWPEAIAKPCFEPIKFDAKIDEKASRVDIFGRPSAWRSRLQGKVCFTSEGLKFQHDELARGAKEKSPPLALIDPAIADSDLAYLFTVLAVERVYYSNGVWSPVHDTFRWAFDCPPSEIEQPSNLTLLEPGKTSFSELSKDPKNAIFPLGHANWHKLSTGGQYLDSLHRLQDTVPWLQQEFSEQKPVIILTEPLASNQQRELYHWIEQAVPTPFTCLDLTEAPQPECAELKELKSSAMAAAGAWLIETTDPEFVAQRLRTGSERLQRIDPQFSRPLFETVTLHPGKDGHIVSCQHQLLPAGDDLLEDKTVILAGGLSPQDYIPIQPLFSERPALQLFNQQKPVAIAGRLLIVTTPLSYPTTLADHSRRRWIVSPELLWEQYQQQAQTHPDYNEKNFQRLRLLANWLHTLPHGQAGAPATPDWHYSQLIRMLSRLKQTHPVENPLKSILLPRYDKNSEIYALVNIACKLLFSGETTPRVRQKKLADYPTEIGAVWRRLNSYNGPALRQLLEMKQDEDLRKLSFNTKKEWHERLNKEEKITVDQPKKSQSHRDKIKDRAVQDLNQHHITLLIGPPGSGKSHLAEQLANQRGQCFIGPGRLAAWKTAKPVKDEKIALVIHEGNLDKESCLNELAALLDSGLPENHEIIFTANSFSMTGRSDHPIWKKINGHTLIRLSDEQLCQEVLTPLIDDALKQLPEFKFTAAPAHQQQLLTVWHDAITLLGENRVTIRELRQLTCRWLYYLSIFETSTTSSEALHEAVTMEFLSKLPLSQPAAAQQRFAYLEHMPGKLKSLGIAAFKKAHKNLAADSFLMSSSRWEIFYRMNEQRQLVEKFGAAKPAILMEGPSGKGKSEMSCHLLKHLDFHQLNSVEELMQFDGDDLRQYFIEVSLTPDLLKDPAWILKMFNGGGHIVFNELNGGCSFPLLNDVFTQVMPEGTRPKYSGCCFWICQNPARGQGRYDTGEDLLNRMQVIPVPEDTEEEFIEMAAATLPKSAEPEAKSLAKDFMETERTHPHLVTSAHFFAGMKQLGQLGIPLEKVQSLLADVDFKDDKPHPVITALQEKAAQLTKLSAQQLSYQQIQQLLRKHQYATTAFNVTTVTSQPDLAKLSKTEQLLQRLGALFREQFVEGYKTVRVPLP